MGHRSGPVLPLAGCVATACLLLRVVHWYLNPRFSLLTHAYATHLRIDSLFLGVATACAYHFHRGAFESLRPWRALLLSTGILLLCPAFLYQLETTPFIYTLGFTLFAAGSAMILVSVLLSHISPSRLVRGVATLGAYSYSVYLWHLYVLSSGVPLAERVYGSPLGYGASTVLYVIGAFLVGSLMAWIVERPAFRLRDRWSPARDRGAVEIRGDSAYDPPGMEGTGGTITDTPRQSDSESRAASN